MNKPIYDKNFPNTLRIVRRKVNNDRVLMVVNQMLEKVNDYKQKQNPYLKTYLEKAKKMDI